MPAHRRLSDHQLIAARWEFEATEVGARTLAAKFGVSRHCIREWITKQRWTKSDELRSYDGDEGQKRFRRDVCAAIKRAVDGKLIQALEATLLLPPAGKWPAPAEPAHQAAAIAAGAWQVPADQPKQPESEPAAVSGKGGLTGKTGRVAATVVRLPVAFLPPPSPNQGVPPTAFPPRSRTEMAAMRVQLASLRGELALQQIQQLEQHDELLWDYHHLLAVYLNPSKFVDVTGLDPEQAAAKLEEIRRQASRLVLPTERDTLAGAVQTLSKALLASFAAKRSAAGISPRQLHGSGRQRDDEDFETPTPSPKLSVAELRQVHDAMMLLKGSVQRNGEPPRPPPPEGLDDLGQARRDPSGARQE